MLNNIKKTKHAFSLVEVLIVVFIMSVAFIAFYTVSTVGTKYIIESKNRLAAAALVNEKMEIVRNLDYADIGTVGGFVNGSIPEDETMTANGRSYDVETIVRYVDDSYDGLCETTCNDPIPNDFKVVKITVSWADSNGQTQAVSSLSRFVPPGLETDEGKAPWAINVSESSGGSLVGVSGADVHITNSDVLPAINTTLTTDSDGYILVPSAAESSGGYHITVSKSGYETIETMDTTASFLPVYAHASVALGSLNVYNFLQNKVSDLTIRTADYQDNPIGSIDFAIAGGKLIGYDTSASPTIVPAYYMSTISSSEVYGQANDTGTTGTTSGEKEYADLSPGSYVIEMDPGAQDGYEFIDFDPSISPAVLDPGISQTYTLRVASSTTEALKITITDNATDPNPVVGATVKLTDSGGTVIFSGKTSSGRGIVFYPDGATPLVAGNYTLDVEATGFNSVTAEPVTVTSGDITEKNIELTQST